MRKSTPNAEAGFTFAELAFALLILVIGAVVLINHISVNFSSTATERDRVFAFSKAQAILSEIQAYVDRGDIDAAIDLSILDDGTTTEPTLTVQTQPGTGDPGVGLLVAADHPISGNYQREGAWVWSRRIHVQQFIGLNNRNVRYVTVRIFKRDGAGIENPMAELSAVINSAASAFPTTQVYDVYLLAVENIPGWWAYMDSMKPFVESMLMDLENRNPGLSFRTHWITKAAFGRNQAYRPYTNAELDSHQVIPDVYNYPGLMPLGSGSGYYFVPDNFKARINVDGSEENGYHAADNPHPYALADFFNHAMRYPEEKALWEARVAEVEAREAQIRAAQLAGTAPPLPLGDMSKEPTLRLFLDDLAKEPTKYTNALIINLHGDLVPMPALRNYSDAAKDTVAHPNWRVVTHPEELRTRNGSAATTDPLRLRMYAYTDDPANYTGPDRMSEPMVVEVMGVDLIDYTDADEDRLASVADLQFVAGGVMVNGSADYAMSWASATHVDDASHPAEEMYYSAEFVAGAEPFTRIYLHNTPLGCPVVDTRGLANTERARLYGMEYIPAPLDAGPAFTTDLTSPGTAGPKNTARWTLELGPTVLNTNRFVNAAGGRYNPTGDVMMTVKTRIASNMSLGDTAWQSGGVMFPVASQPDNLSTTYAWWSDSREDVPFTERAQFHGDPRHLPYKDCFDGGDDFPNSYNWCHDSLVSGVENATLDFPSIDGARLRNLWDSSLWCDVPRYFELLRTGIVESSCVYTSMSGFSCYYMGVGNDVGYDSTHGYPSSIPTDLTPYGATGTGFLDTVTAPRKLPMAWNGTTWWTGFPWLGELYPDSMGADFFDATSGFVRGNLPAGTGVGQVFQWEANAAYGSSSRLAWGTSITSHHQRTSVNGCSAFFNIGSSTSRFRHLFGSGSASLSGVGDQIAEDYTQAMPETAPASRPFQLNYAGPGGSHWDYAPYTTRHTGSIEETFYEHSSGTGSGVVKLTNPSGTKAGYVVVNGLDDTVEGEDAFLAQWAALSLVYSFCDAGQVGNANRILQLPRVEIEEPTDITELNNPAAIDVLFGIDWTRWDGKPYTQVGTFGEDESQLQYVLMWSADEGDTYYYVQDGAAATPGTLPASALHIETDTVGGDESYSWSVPSGTFPEGSYLLRIECYRDGAPLHFAWHQNRIYIQR